MAQETMPWDEVYERARRNGMPASGRHG
jgi:hypothetical protein